MDCADQLKTAVIGGTGLDDAAQQLQGCVRDVETVYGCVSLMQCAANETSYWFLARHGLQHNTPPHLINYRAQIAGLKAVGVERIIGVCSVGSLDYQLPPGSLVVLTDFIDMTRRHTHTFWNPQSKVWHSDFTQPYCAHISGILLECCRRMGFPPTTAVYAGVDGPRYETPAEVRLYASWGAQVVGMTNVPEAILAREAGLCYGALGVVTNFAAGLTSKPQSHDEVKACFASLSEQVLQVVSQAVDQLSSSLQTSCSCRYASLI